MKKLSELLETYWITKDDILKLSKVNESLIYKYRPYKCTKCPKEYYRKYLLTNHIQSKHKYFKSECKKIHNKFDKNLDD